MNPFHRWSIRNKVLGIVTASAIVPLILGFGLLLINDKNVLEREMVENSVVVARVTAENSIADLAFGDRDAASITLAKLASIPTIRSVHLYDANGKLFSAWPRAGAKAGHPAPRAGLRQSRGEELIVTEPVIFNGERYGTIALAVSKDALAAKFRARILTLVVLMIVIAAIVFLLASRLEKLVSSSILALADVARDISEKHDYSVRVSVESGDEVGTLAVAFNEMLTQIERRQRERDEADQRTREKSQFLANMSHELRTPLNAIIGFSEVLRGRLEGRLSEREEKFLENINYSGQHLLGIVNDILDLSKIEAGRMDVNPELFSVRFAIEGVTALMRGVSGRRNVNIETRVQEDLPQIDADPVKIKQVLYNLLSNAVKFSPPGSTVTIRALTAHSDDAPLNTPAVRITVHDQGIGIDPKDHQRIFMEFQQVDGTTSRQFEGTGLGLTLVKKFVELHGGVVEVESAIGQGSTFTVTLPLRFVGGAGAVRRAEPVERGARRVLVIEDDVESFRTIARELRRAGFVPVHARSGEEGLSAARTIRPSAITLDLSLPGLGGFEVLETLRSDSQTRRIPVIIVSMSEDRELGLALGAQEYFVKPVDGDLLVESLRRLVAPASGARVLVIDDDRALHDMLEERLGPHGYLLMHAYATSDGVARANTDPPALIILDVTMDGMDGFDAAARLQANPRTAALPLLVVTKEGWTGGDRLRLDGKIQMLQKSDLGGRRFVHVVEELLRHSPPPPAG